MRSCCSPHRKATVPNTRSRSGETGQNPAWVRRARIEGGRRGVGIIDFQRNQGATRHLQADPASGRAYRRHDPFADDSHRPLYRRGCCRQELPQALRAESNEVPDPGAARFRRDAQRPACFAGRSLRNGPQVASFRRLSGFVDDRRGWPRHGGLGRAGQSGGRAAVRSARRLGRARESLQQQRTVAAVAGIRGSRGGRTARREGRRIPSREASAGPRRSTRRPRDHKGGAGCDRRRYRPDGRFQPGPQSRRRLAALPHD